MYGAATALYLLGEYEQARVSGLLVVLILLSHFHPGPLRSYTTNQPVLYCRERNAPRQY